MRVISGKARGKKLVSLEGLNTRPTLDRVKEALFNIIQFDIENKDVLDLFAGSGALGIEALSRGAKTATFCDNSYDAMQIIKTNITNTHNEKNSIVINKDYNLALNSLSKQNKKFDIIFLDPPYKADFGIKALEMIIKLNILAEEGFIILETDDEKKEQNIREIEGLKVFDKRKYGKIMLIFIRKE